MENPTLGRIIIVFPFNYHLLRTKVMELTPFLPTLFYFLFISIHAPWADLEVSWPMNTRSMQSAGIKESYRHG
jgi:hypothetical protein